MSQKFADYVVYKVTSGDALVKSGWITIYEHPADQTTFYACNDSYLIDTTWIYKMSWENTTDTEQTYTLDYVTGPKEAEAADTTESVTKTTSLTVPANSTLTFYQKKYRFRDSMFFVLDTSGQEYNVGSPDGSDVLKDEREVEIMSEDYLIVGATLSRSTAGTMDVPSVVRADVEDGREKQDPKDLPEMVKDVLVKMGLKLDAEPANIPAQ
ncbi:uncharacterized protein EV420DRAFT_1479116 [Desarmillaria tabescens]|uniref:Uncharacterized protein n=1 Tax=Armillaria tabescens TaxID=1929756 RepID=A0AA39N5X0_ARMTA|nr:uncharacterized protein EV420DRAFT_1479116 [Desarmillaria tabescens]KAK0459077.1 hypothetical protein EV420DRAFT_1479116 [Desarmillaria tabescens]